MADRQILVRWVFEAVIALGGEASVTETAKQIWKEHEPELKASGDLFYTWQYDMRWAAQRLRDEKKFAAASGQSSRKWAIAK